MKINSCPSGTQPTAPSTNGPTDGTSLTTDTSFSAMLTRQTAAAAVREPPAPVAHESTHGAKPEAQPRHAGTPDSQPATKSQAPADAAPPAAKAGAGAADENATSGTPTAADPRRAAVLDRGAGDRQGDAADATVNELGTTTGGRDATPIAAEKTGTARPGHSESNLPSDPSAVSPFAGLTLPIPQPQPPGAGLQGAAQKLGGPSGATTAGRHGSAATLPSGAAGDPRVAAGPAAADSSTPQAEGTDTQGKRGIAAEGSMAAAGPATAADASPTQAANASVTAGMHESAARMAQDALAAFGTGAGHPGATGATAAASGPASAPAGAQGDVMANIGSAEFAPSLALTVKRLARDGVQEARLQLNPAEMGPLDVRIAVDGHLARVEFQAHAAATRSAIEAGLPELASALRDSGLTLAGGGVFQQFQGSPREAPGGSGPTARAGSASGLARIDNPASEPSRSRQLGVVDLYA